MHAPRIIQFLFETFLNIINIIYIYIFRINFKKYAITNTK